MDVWERVDIHRVAADRNKSNSGIQHGFFYLIQYMTTNNGLKIEFVSRKIDNIDDGNHTTKSEALLDEGVGIYSRTMVKLD